MSGIVRLVLATVVAAIGVFFAFPGARAQAADRPPAMVDAAAEIARAEAEWRSKEASLGHEEIPAGAATYEKDGIEYTVIRDCAGFEAIEENLAGNYIVANDLDMTDFTTPIGWGPVEILNTEPYIWRDPVPFSGIFDGNNYRIKNLINLVDVKIPFHEWNRETHTSVSYGIALFNNNSGIIRNIIIDESCRLDCYRLRKFDDENRQWIGDNVAFIAAQNWGTIENCYNHGSIIAEHTQKLTKVVAGGICGELIYWRYLITPLQEKMVIRNCVNFGEIALRDFTSGLYVSSYAGGIFGFYTNLETELTGLYNFGSLYAENAGGIGNAVRGENETDVELPYDRIVIENSANYGTVTAQVEYKRTENSGMAGGIAANGAAQNCKNYGTVKGKDVVGGIVGKGVAVGSENYGAISGRNEVGGIVGRAYPRYDNSIEQCVQYGSVSGENYVGGIAGNSIYAQIKNNQNYGDVKGAGVQVDGILGGSEVPEKYYQAGQNTQLSGNENYGRVESEGLDQYRADRAAKKRRNGIVIGCAAAGAALAVGAIALMLAGKKRKNS